MVAAVPDEVSPRDTSLEQAFVRGLRTVAAASAVGLVLGLVVGGIGSRLAMRLLFLTTGPSVRGLISDDGFRIGQFDAGDTLSLVLFGAAVGVLGGVFYLAVRPFLIGPRWLRWTTCGLASAAVVGSMLVHPDGVDFTALGPTWLAIGLFVLIPGLFGLLVPPAVDWASREGGWFSRASLPFALAPLVVFVFPPLLVLVALPAVAVIGLHFAVQRDPSLSGIANSPTTRWIVRACWLAVAGLGVFALATDISDLMTTR